MSETDQVELNDPILQKVFHVAAAMVDKKAENVKVLDVSDTSGFTDYFVIASALNDRQVHAICDGVDKRMELLGVKALSREGYADARWVLVDYGDFVIHVFLDALREYYDLESLWQEAEQVKIPEDVYAPAATRMN